MSTQSELIDGLHGVTVPAGVKAVLEAHREASERLAAEPLLPAAKQERQAALSRDAQAKIDAEAARIEAETERALDAAEGEIRGRAKALTGARMDSERRAALDAARDAGALLVRELDDPGAIADEFENALVSEDLLTVRTIGTLAVQRLRRLERSARPGESRQAVTQILLSVESRFSNWRKSNLSAAEGLRELQRQRGNAKAALRYAVETALRAYGISTKAGTLHVGAGFDRLAS